MATDGNTVRELVNESRLNVATLLQEPVGAIRDIHIRLDAFALDDDLHANDLEAEVRFTRLRRQVLATGTVRANIALECARCLTMFEQAVETSFTEQFRQSHDVRSGAGIIDHDQDDDALDVDDDELFEIDEGHELDLAEALRQHLVLALPMVPVCGPDCPGPPARTGDEPEDSGEEERKGHFSVLSSLLDDESEQANDDDSVRDTPSPNGAG